MMKGKYRKYFMLDTINQYIFALYHLIKCYSCISDAISEKVTNSVDSGGAKPKIREKDILMNDKSTTSDKSEENRLGAEAAETVSENKNDATDDSNTNAAFECNICLDVAREAVISMCGHLFCWPCLHTWLETRPNRQICPVCKAGIGKDKVVPLYGRGK